MSEYGSYIRSHHWRSRRAEAIRRSHKGGVPCCEVCGRQGTPHATPRDVLTPLQKHGRTENSNGLEVHHVTYERLGCELPNDLIVVCDDCHGRAHEDPDYGEAIALAARTRLY